MNEMSEMNSVNGVGVKESKESEAYQKSFRNALIHIVLNYFRSSPNLKRDDPEQYLAASRVHELAEEMKLTPIMLWLKVNDIENKLPRPFYFFWYNRFGDALVGVLKKYPKDRLNVHFMQEQFELSQRVELNHGTDVTALKKRSAVLEARLSTHTSQLDELRRDNTDLIEKNRKLQLENRGLRLELEQLKVSKAGKSEAINLHQNEDNEICELREQLEETTKRLSELLNTNNTLLKKYNDMEIELKELRINNAILAQRNQQLYKENLDLRRESKSNTPNNSAAEEDVPLSGGSLPGFFRNSFGS